MSSYLVSSERLLTYCVLLLSLNVFNIESQVTKGNYCRGILSQGVCFYIHENKAAFGHHSDCVYAEPTSAKQMDDIRTYFERYIAYIGFQNPTGTEITLYSNKSDLTAFDILPYFRSGEPNNGDEKCVNGYSFYEGLNDVDCSKSLLAICSTTSEQFAAQQPLVCGQHYSDPSSGVFMSPGYPVKYENEQQCDYYINVNDDLITVTFDDFQLENGTDRGCEYDRVEIYRSIETSYQTLIDKRCGNNGPVMAPISTHGGQMLLRFISDSHTTSRGFKASYSSYRRRDCSATGNISTEDFFTWKPFSIANITQEEVFTCNLICWATKSFQAFTCEQAIDGITTDPGDGRVNNFYHSAVAVDNPYIAIQMDALYFVTGIRIYGRNAFTDVLARIGSEYFGDPHKLCFYYPGVTKNYYPQTFWDGRCNPKYIRGRSVQISIKGPKATLKITELEIHRLTCTASNSTGHFPCNKAIDGIINLDIKNNYQSDIQDNPYITIDLGNTYPVSGIRIYGGYRRFEEQRRNIDCYEGVGRYYEGNVSWALNKQKIRRPCVSWNDPAGDAYRRKNYEKDFPDAKGIDGAGSKCRNPSYGQETKPWCYITLTKKKRIDGVYWKYCDIPKCLPEDCYEESKKGYYYKGKLSKTVSGKSCVNWKDANQYKEIKFFEKSYDAVKNYCRNPGNPEDNRFSDYKPWCYVTTYNIPGEKYPYWDYCEMSICNKVTLRIHDIEVRVGQNGDAGIDNDRCLFHSDVLPISRKQKYWDGVCSPRAVYGRYVTIQLVAKNAYFEISEAEISHISCLDFKGYYTCEQTIDGITDSKHYYQTPRMDNPKVTIDMGNSYPISGIRIYGSGQTVEQLHNVEVRIGKERSKQNDICLYYPGVLPISDDKNYWDGACSQTKNLQGRYVTIQLRATNVILTLVEVQINTLSCVATQKCKSSFNCTCQQAIDGVISNQYYRSARADNPYITIDLASSHLVSGIRIYGRYESSEKFYQIEAKVGNNKNASDNKRCMYHSALLPIKGHDYFLDDVCSPKMIHGRYVTIQLDAAQDYLTIAEIQISRVSCSASKSFQSNFACDLAIDGNTKIDDLGFGQSTMPNYYLSEDMDKPYITIDMGHSYTVITLRIFTPLLRSSSGIVENLHSLEVRIGNQRGGDDTNKQCLYHPGPLPISEEQPFWESGCTEWAVNGRYVSIQLNTTKKLLAITEVQIGLVSCSSSKPMPMHATCQRAIDGKFEYPNYYRSEDKTVHPFITIDQGNSHTVSGVRIYYRQFDKPKDTGFTKHARANCNGNNLGVLLADSVEQCKIKCLETDVCVGYVYNFKTKECYLKNDICYTTLLVHNSADYYQINIDNGFTKHARSICSDYNLGVLLEYSVTQCKIKCLKLEACVAFVYNFKTKKCYLKKDICSKLLVHNSTDYYQINREDMFMKDHNAFRNIKVSVGKDDGEGKDQCLYFKGVLPISDKRYWDGTCSPKPVYGRYVTVQLLARTYLKIIELQLKSEDVKYSKLPSGLRCTATSHLVSSSVAMQSSASDCYNAIDGEKSNQEHCYRSTSAELPYLTMDFGKEMVIDFVKIYGINHTKPKLKERFHNVNITVGNNKGPDNSQCYYQAGIVKAFPSTGILSCTRSMIGRYLSVKLEIKLGFLEVCEIEFGRNRQHNNNAKSTDEKALYHSRKSSAATVRIYGITRIVRDLVICSLILYTVEKTTILAYN